MAKKITLVFTETQIESLLEMISTIESMYGCSEPGEHDWDAEMKRQIRNIDRMFKNNGYERQ